jgi:hypothetical protein
LNACSLQCSAEADGSYVFLNYKIRVMMMYLPDVLLCPANLHVFSLICKSRNGFISPNSCQIHEVLGPLLRSTPVLIFPDEEEAAGHWQVRRGGLPWQGSVSLASSSHPRPLKHCLRATERCVGECGLAVGSSLTRLLPRTVSSLLQVAGWVRD